MRCAAIIRRNNGRFGTADSRQAQRGFTLIELLVVISIIALLIAVLLPVLEQARAVARKTICATQMRQVGIGTMSYINEDRSGQMFLYREMHMSRIYYQGYFTSTYPKLGEKSRGEEIFHCPSHPWPVTHPNAFMYNSEISHSSTHYCWPRNYYHRIPVEARTGTVRRNVEEIPDLSRSVLLGETRYNNPTRDARGAGNYGFQDGHIASYDADFALSNYADSNSPIRMAW